MRRVLLPTAVLVVVGGLTACGANSAAPPSSTPAPTTGASATPETTQSAAPAAGVRPGVVLVNCDVPSGAGVRVSGFGPDGTSTGTVEFPWLPVGSPGAAPALTCLDFAIFTTQASRADGHLLRSAFNEDYTAALATDTEGENSTIGWLSPELEFTPLTTPVSGDFTKQLDHDPMFHPATDRVFFRDADDKLRSVAADGTGQKAETSTASDKAVLVPTVAPLLEDKGSGVVYNRSGTLVAGLISAAVAGTDQIVVVPTAERDSLRQATSGVPITGDFTGRLELHGFLDDTTVLLTDDAQIYAVKLSGQTATVTTVLANDKLTIWDVTASSDGKSVAFLAGEGTSTYLYTVPVAGGTPTKLTTVTGATALLEFTA